MSELMRSVLLVYPDGNHQWKAPDNLKIRGGKIGGVRPVAIYLLNPYPEVADSANWLIDRKVGQVHITLGGPCV